MRLLGWLPWNRRWQTEPVSLAEAASAPEEDRPQHSNDTRHCVWCGLDFLAESAPDGYARYCTSQCVDEAQRDRFLGGNVA